MEVGELISKYRKELNMTIDDLAAKSGVPKGTINKIIGGVTKAPTLENVRAIAYALGKTLNDFDDPPKSIKSAPPELSDEARKVAKDYEGLDRHGRNLTKIVITEEQKRMEEERRRQEVGGDEPQNTRIIPLYYTPSAAGMTSPAVGEDFDYIEISKDAPRNADFAVKIDGDSMEPYIRDGSIVYVNREPLENGDVGIFYVDGDMVCKQYYKDENGNVRLLSLNRNRHDADRFISSRSDDTVLTYYGRVILPRRPMISWA